MAKKALACVAALIAMIVIPQVMAGCYVDPRPIFKVKMSEIVQCSFRPGGEQLSADTDIALFMQLRNLSGQFVCDDVVLNPDDAKIFRDTINRFNKANVPFVTVHIERQGNTTYGNFLEKARKTNANECDCKYYSNVTRTSAWTSYLEEENCEHDNSCRAVPPEGCLSRKVYDVTSNFLLMLCITIGGALLVLMILYNIFKA
jgi:hypothetical protein